MEKREGRESREGESERGIEEERKRARRRRRRQERKRGYFIQTYIKSKYNLFGAHHDVLREGGNAVR
jgi:hypothetical protein